ncbi:hypothetical protein HPP92_022487 [Vanilla planifolia]|uniref:LysM domain-containing protein n=1 Tax=Vanilla planifolia TaxID=51239 RepID=A0A835UDP1_VANPL|nr:hypothetical protein HPP92_022487 [Vanilla planifolia]
MQAEGGLGNFHISEDGLLDAPLYRSRETNGLATIPVSHSDHSFSASGVNYIEHTVSKMDTLVGVAIKYGVEVADIKRINGLVTDLQMFAHKSLQIPLPGRHPPSPILSNGSCEDRGKKTPPRQSHDDVLDSLQSLKLKSPPRRVSPAMCSLQGYYGLRQLKKDLSPEGTEMAVYKSGNSFLLEEKTVLKQQDALHSLHRKSRSLVNVILHENGDITGDISESDRFIRRRSKPDADQSLRTPEILLKEESPIGAFFGTKRLRVLLCDQKMDARPNSIHLTKTHPWGLILYWQMSLFRFANHRVHQT